MTAKKYQEELKEIRCRLPIGLAQAVMLLTELHGNVDLVEQRFKQDTRRVLVAKTGITENSAEEYLQKYQYDLLKLLHALEQAKFTLTEKILRWNLPIGSRLSSLALTLIDQGKRQAFHNPLTLEELKALPTEQYPFMLLMDWLSFIDCEAFEYAISHWHLDLIIQEIEQTICLVDVAAAIRGGKDRAMKLRTMYFPAIAPIKACFTFSNFLNRDQAFLQYEKDFNARKEQLFEAPFEYVVKHKDKFPK